MRELQIVNRRLVTMTDLKLILEMHKDIDDVRALLEELDTLRFLYWNRNFAQMQRHILELTQKYFVETAVWNMVNYNIPSPTDHHQHFINAENFLFAQGFRKLNELGRDWRKVLNEEERIFIETITKPME